MYEDKSGNIWFVRQKKLGLLDFSRPNDEMPYTLVYFPELDGKVLGGYESVYVYDNDHVFVGANKGGILLNYNKYKERISKPNILLRKVIALDAEKNEIVLFGGHGSFSQKHVELSYKLNSFQFDFSSTLYDQLDNVEFSYLMEG